jgi:hypothetical protein
VAIERYDRVAGEAWSVLVREAGERGWEFKETDGSMIDQDLLTGKKRTQGNYGVE